jgi:hypothetical protein
MSHHRREHSDVSVIVPAGATGHQALVGKQLAMLSEGYCPYGCGRLDVRDPPWTYCSCCDRYLRTYTDGRGPAFETVVGWYFRAEPVPDGWW